MTGIRQIRRIAVCCVFLVPLSRVQAQGDSGIEATKHDLSRTGPGRTKVLGETEICKFCHTPHAANPIAPLWNRQDPGVYYQTYESTTLTAEVGQPTGSSRLCLSCHDGTIALTQTYNPRNAPGGSIHISARDSGYLGTDLSDDHPISFVYDSSLVARNPNLVHPSALPEPLVLDRTGQLQCTTCHDPHDNKYGKFLTMSNEESQMCRSCHAIEGWAFSAHATSTASLLSAQRDDWSNTRAGSVRQAACGACHRPHNAGGRQRLLRHEAEEDNCLSCHDGTVAAKNIAGELSKLSAHDVSRFTGVHDPTGSPSTMADHVECADCHDPHQAARGRRTRPPFIKPAMKGATGVSGSGSGLARATYEYEVCYKCHSGSGSRANPVVDRVLISTNVADEFSPANASFHPVETQGQNSDVPSLLQPYLTSSIIYCTDCHSSDSKAGGPRGPHGSTFEPLLVRNYSTLDNTVESPGAYALCYGCHSRTSILANASFVWHKKHIDEKTTPCSVCHDPHGVSARQSALSGGTHLINFDRRVVQRSSATGEGPSFEDRGFRRGSCMLKCHEVDHSPKKYGD